MTGERASSQAIATCTGVAPRRRATRPSIHPRRIAASSQGMPRQEGKSAFLALGKHILGRAVGEIVAVLHRDQRGGRRGDDAARRRIGQSLQRDQRTSNDLGVLFRAPVGTRPRLPELFRRPQGVVDIHWLRKGQVGGDIVRTNGTRCPADMAKSTCSHCVLPPMRNPVSSRCFTGAPATRSRTVSASAAFAASAMADTRLRFKARTAPRAPLLQIPLDRETPHTSNYLNFSLVKNMLKPSNPLARLTCSVGRSGTALPAGLSPGAAHRIVWIGRAELAASLDQASLPLVCTIRLAGAAHFVVGIGLAKLPTCLDQASLPFLPRHGGRR